MILCMIRTTAPHLVCISERMAIMNAISKEYLFLFNAITDAEASLDRLRQQLIAVQQQAEELFLEEGEPASARRPA